MTKSDYIQAFPQPESGSLVAVGDTRGMELRDWFAGMALQGWLASFTEAESHPCISETEQTVAKQAYALADAMMEARKK